MRYKLVFVIMRGTLFESPVLYTSFTILEILIQYKELKPCKLFHSLNQCWDHPAKVKISTSQYFLDNHCNPCRSHTSVSQILLERRYPLDLYEVNEEKQRLEVEIPAEDQESEGESQEKTNVKGQNHLQ